MSTLNSLIKRRGLLVAAAASLIVPSGFRRPIEIAQADGVNNSGGSSGSVSASPSTISGLKRWWSAAAITPVADGTAISSWPDSSPTNDPLVQATGGSQPLYYNYTANGNPGVIFTAANSSWMTFTRETDFQTIFIVLSMIDPAVNTSTTGAVLGDSSGADLAYIQANGPFFVDPSNTPSAKLPSPVRINGKYAGALGAMCRQTGLCLMVIRLPVGQTMSFSQVARDRLVNNRFTSMTLAEVALYNRILLDSEVAQIESYFLAKYNLNAGVNPSYGARAFAFGSGDSIMKGQGATNHLALLATLLGGVNKLAVADYAVTGTTAQQWTQLYLGKYQYTGLSGLSSYAPFNFTMPNVSHVWAGTNDLFANVLTPAQIYAYLSQIWQYERAQGKTVIAYTIMSRSDAGVPAGFNTNRATLNALIRGDPTLYDYLVDAGANQIMGFNGAELNATYFQADHVHPTTAGQQIIANMAYAGYKSLGLA